jgi:Protein of unknown function (DUF2934)
VGKQRIPASRSVSKEDSKPGLAPVLHSGDIATLAYQLWQARGCPEGSPEIDWFQAEQLLRDPIQTAGSQVSDLLLTRGASA